jgi:hypothetical protein
MGGGTVKAKLAGLVAVALVAVSCGGGGSALTADEYFPKVETIIDQAITEMASAGQEFQDATGDATDASAVGAAVTLHRRNRDALDTERKALEQLAPPAEAASSHRDTVDALGDLVGALDDAFASMGQASDLDGIQSILAEAGVFEADGRLQTACIKMKGVAQEAGIEVALPC